MSIHWQEIGPYRGLIYNASQYEALCTPLGHLPQHLSSVHATLLQGGRHQTLRLQLEDTRGGQHDLVVKQFGRQSAWKDHWDRRHGSKALRTYTTAAFMVGHKIATTTPVAILERWQGQRLQESYFISHYLDQTISFKDFLLQLFAGRGSLQLLQRTITAVAEAVRQLHDAGCRHNDLGNQNLLLAPPPPTTTGHSSATATKEQFTPCKVAFLDLNRARCGRSLTIWDRARDLSRITLPPPLLNHLFAAYWRGTPPLSFRIEESLIRHAFAWHTFTRRFRHPLRELRYRALRHTSDAPQHAVYPKPHQIELWDAERQSYRRLSRKG